AWHYHDDDVAGPTAAATIRVTGLPADLRRARVHRTWLDATHGNAFTAWQAMGSPAALDDQQRDRLRAAATLAAEPAAAIVAAGTAIVRASLARHAVALITVEW